MFCSFLDMAMAYLICNLPLGSASVVTLTSKGIKKLVECSKIYKDKLYEKILDIHSLKLHIACRKSYTHKRNVCAAQKKTELQGVSQEKPTRSNADCEFNFHINCLFCGKVCINTSKFKRSIRTVATLEIKTNIESRCSSRKDDWSNAVYTGIATTNDLVAAEARYHKNCYITFFSRLFRKKLRSTCRRAKRKSI